MRKLHTLVWCFFLSLICLTGFSQNVDDDKLQLLEEMNHQKMEQYMQRMGFQDMFEFEPTGDIPTDYESYVAAKLAYMAEHPDMHDDMVPEEIMDVSGFEEATPVATDPPFGLKPGHDQNKSNDCDDINCNFNGTNFTLTVGGEALFTPGNCGEYITGPGLTTGDLITFDVIENYTYTFSTCFLTFIPDTYIRIWNAADFSLVAQNDDAGFPACLNPLHSTVEWQASFTGQIIVGVSRYSFFPFSACNVDPKIGYLLYMNCEPAPPPANDLCDDAETIDCGETLSGTTLNATFDAAPFCGTGNTPNTPGVWYSFTPEVDACVTASTCNQADYDTKISVYTGQCGGLACVAGGDDNIPDCQGLTTEVTFNVSAGLEYLILVHGFAEASGNFDLSLICNPLPANDDVCNAINIGIGTTPFSNVCATVQNMEVDPGAGTDPDSSCDSQDGWCAFETDVQTSIWYSFTAPPTGLVSIYATGFDTQLALWEVGDCADFGTFNEIAANDDGGLDLMNIFEAGIINACVEPGGTYFIQLDGFAGAQGSGNLIIDEEIIPEIAVQPQDFYGCANFNPTFMVELVPNGAAPVFFQWQVSTDDGANWTDLPGETMPMLTLIDPPPSFNLNQYRVMVYYSSNMDCAVISEPALLELYLEGELACNSYVQVSLDEQCFAEITPEMILEGPFDYQFYIVELTDHNGNLLPEPVVGFDDIGYHFTATIINICNGNSCWGEIWVEDKMPPVFTSCNDITVIDCFDADNYYPEAIDNCYGPVVPELISETFTPNDCNPEGDLSYTKIIHRVYQATDLHGNVSEMCTVNVQLQRADLEKIVWPAHWDIAAGNLPPAPCDNLVYSEINGQQVLSPNYYQVPKINNVPLYPLPNIYCNLSVTFDDTELEEINCVRKIMRVWTVREWFCDGEITKTEPQFIEIVDENGPIFEDCPTDITVTTNGYSCEMDIHVPMPSVFDVCHGIKHIDLEYPGGFESDWQGGYITLPDGIHEIKLIAYDDCHNSNTCSYKISVEDHTSPVAVCDENTVVSVTLDGEAEVHAESFDDGSYDDCQLKSMLVRRMDGGCPDCAIPKYDGFYYLGEFEGHYYYLSDYRFRGDKSMKIAKAMGGYVVSFNVAGEEAWVTGKVREINSQDSYYIGLTDKVEEGIYEWQDGSSLSYSNWAGGEPDGEGDFAIVNVDEGDQWDNVNYPDEHLFLLEVDDPCNWSSYEQFCCSDIGRADVMVGFRVIDRWGNYNECMVVADIQDKIFPDIYCPPDLTVSCKYDYASLDVFGNVREAEAYVEHIAVPTEYIINSSGPLYDGWAYDNCDVTVTSDPMSGFNQCGIGYIERTFTATDPDGRATSCVQRIDVINEDPFDGYDPLDLIWPPHYDDFGCADPDAYPPELTGFPQFPGEDECSLVASTFEDETFTFNDPIGDACFKIIRNWTVIDWCQFGVSETYTWNYSQIIKINNANAPEFTSSCEFTSTCTYDATCEGGYIELIMTATDDCTEEENLRWEYKVDEFSNGSFDRYGNSSDASAEYPVGEHIIQWTVEDKCGNKRTCEQPFLIENCKPATPYCLRGIAVDLMPVDTDNNGEADWGMIQIWASDLDAGSSHACEEVPIQFSFSPDPSDNFREFDCNDLGEHFIDMYVISQTSTGPVWSYCTATLTIQDNMGFCGQEGFAQVSGSITNEHMEPLTGVTVDLEGSELEAVDTDQEGNYAFPEMLMGGSYAVNPQKNIDPLNGVSTLDLVIMQRHVLGLENLNSPYKVIASDINKDQKVSALDMLALRKLILGLDENFINNESWRFVEADYDFEDPADPLEEGFPEKYFIGQLNHNIQANFIGLKIGDVSEDASPNGFISTEIRKTDVLSLYVEDRLVKQGESLSIPFYVAQSKTIRGYQFTLTSDGLFSQINGLESGVISISAEHFGTQKLGEGILTTSWNESTTQELQKHDVLFRLDITANRSGLLSQMLEINSDITKAEAYNAQYELMDLELTFRGEDGDLAGQVLLFQNAPNPFSDQTLIKFYLPSDMEARISVYDVNGRLIHETSDYYTKGFQELQIRKDQLGENGVFYYRLHAKDQILSKKMVLLK